MAAGPLAGVRVLDLTHYIAGPYCTKLLADYGAEVIKVERPGVGDGARRLGPFPGDEPHPEKSGTFLHLNTNKYGVTLDLKSATGNELFRRLAAECDVVVESFSPRVMPSLGLDYEALSELNPRLVMTSISNFGPSGPYRDYKATDMVEFAMGGWMHSTGTPDKPPLFPGGPYASYVAGQYAAMGTLFALLEAEGTGEGQAVSVSIQEAVLSSLVYDTVAYSYTGQVRRRQKWPMRTVMYSVQPCAGGYVGFFPGHGEQRWRDLWSVLLERPEVLEDPRFADPRTRREHEDELEPIIQEALAEHTSGALFETGQMLRMFVATVPDVGEILGSPHHAARGYFTTVAHPVAGELTYTGAPFRPSETPWRLERPAPLLGEHNEQVFGERLGLRRDEIVALRANGVI
jgi:crotonobetainyl-CoA:carnitine CoA-transferase CaiB-like acyl-CoA transferase